MLDGNVVKKIESFVYSKPRSMDEIAKHIGKNWRTADRYVSEMEKDFGTVSTRIFREGSRGALKIVFWSSVEKFNKSVFQEKLEEEILTRRRKEDFSSFEIFQYVPDDKKIVYVESAKNENDTDLDVVTEILKSTKKQLLMFSGNLSFVNIGNKKSSILESVEDCIKRGVTIRIICRVDLAGQENVQKIINLNHKYGKNVVEIRHRDQPLRGFISDNQVIRLKEVQEPTGKINELNKRVFIFYTIRDKEWAEWLSRIFWKMFSSSLDSGKRLEELKKLKI
ncbi:MAG TPA: hypothetical protein VEC16_01025 [Alphaproteobacteria bacterium]|nr:hypothetical protein [Alphaproteobacteria bacterium]